MRQNFNQYFVKSSIEEQWGIYATSTGYQRSLAGESYPPDRHPEDHMFSWNSGRILPTFQLLYISEGEGVFESQGHGVFEIKAGDLFLVFPGIWHRYQPKPETGWVERWIGLDGPFLKSLSESKLISPDRPVVTVGQPKEVELIWQAIQHQVEIQNADVQIQLGLLGLQLISNANATRDAVTTSDFVEHAIKLAQDLIQSRLTETIAMESLADEVGLPYWQFRRTFRIITGISPKQYQIQVRLRRAQELLANTQLSIADIAESLGYDTPFHFSADFKKRTGQSPENWRNELLKTG
jgi:AraC-like DNA-binding protein